MKRRATRRRRSVTLCISVPERTFISFVHHLRTRFTLSHLHLPMMAPIRDESDSGSEYSPGGKSSAKQTKRERDDSSDSECAPAKRSVKQGSPSKSPSPKKPRNVGAARKAGFNTGPWSAEEGACDDEMRRKGTMRRQ
jgi:hypothetical protein